MVARSLSTPGGQLRLIVFTGALLLMGLWACIDAGGPGAEVLKDPSEVSVIQLDQSAPSLLTDSVSFYAVEGQDRFVELHFDSAGVAGDRLLRFEVGKKSLDRLPDGHRVKHGDSVLIVIRATDPTTLQFDFQPSGLVFKHSSPAVLTIGYGHALTSVAAAPFRDPGHGHGGHGHHGGDSTAHAEADLAIWQQEEATGPYRKLESSVDTEAREIEAEVPGFSKYAVAY